MATLYAGNNLADPAVGGWHQIARTDGVPVTAVISGDGASATVMIQGCNDPTTEPGVDLLASAWAASAGAVFEWWPYLRATVPSVSGSPDVAVAIGARITPA